MPNIERLGDGTIVVSPKNEADQSGLVVIAHGLGDTAEGFVDVAEQLCTELPHLKFILPTAPTQPVTLNMGMAMPSWYDITGLDERSNENCKGIADSRKRIENILQNEHSSTKLPYDRMVLMGFSQGGALSLFTGMQFSSKLAGIVCMSGYLPAASQFQITDGLQDTPILHCHGSQDMVVNVAMAGKSQSKVQEAGATNYEVKLYPTLPHSVNMEELKDVQNFIEKVLPPDETCKIELKSPRDMSVKELKAALRKAGISTVGLMEKSEFIQLLEEHRNK